VDQRRGDRLDPSRDDLVAAFSEAYEILQRRLGPDRADDLGDAVVKWWTYVSGQRVPEYLLADGKISVPWLAYWLARTADERRARDRKRDQQRRERGFVVVSDIDKDGEPVDVCDRTAPDVDAVLSGICARAIIEKLGGVDAIDPVVRYRALDFSYEEIGGALDIAPGTARVRMSRAAGRLASKLEHAA
jgi:DNA-directed RNA polymerase specialized sigma24 family protein